MKNIFPRLAVSGIKKNKKLYIPYIISCIGSVTMYYIIAFLSESSAVNSMRGGMSMGSILGLGKFVIVAFSLLFLLYTNSFLIRRRNKEFGLYNILGMNKKGIYRVITWETLITAAISIGAGLFFGITLSKLAELLLLYLCHMPVSYSFSVPGSSVIYTATLYLAVFLVLLIKSVIQVRRSDTLELMKSENVGEKPPKANWVFAALGVLILGGAYFMSATIKSPLSALFMFLIAVVMVIVGIYLLFMAGSVALCKLLQKNKKYYYKKNHFVSVSSLAYRMKRNGAGLASICILSTMVLVMIASSASLYFGAEDSIKSRYPQENQLSINMPSISSLSEENCEKFRKGYESVFEKHGVTPENVTEYSYASITGLLSDTKVEPDFNGYVNKLITYDNVRDVFFMSEDAYNKTMGTDIHLKPHEAMYYTIRCEYNQSTFEMNGVKLNVIGELKEYPTFSDAEVAAVSSIMMVVKDLNELQPLEELADFQGFPMLTLHWYYGYDLKENDTVTINVFKDIQKKIGDFEEAHREGGGYSYFSDCLAEQRNDFYVTYGGLFFIGGLFSIMFVFAMAMIIYYKQISEGFEDMERFGIMQKVGMTKHDIKKSINSQTLTVFFAPLVFAGINFVFAFPPIWKILQLFNLHNLSLVIIISLIAFAVFGIMYMAIYKLTARAYFSLVSKKE